MQGFHQELAWAPGKLFSCEDDFAAWLDHLKESFSYEEGSAQIVFPTCENQLPPCCKC